HSRVWQLDSQIERPEKVDRCNSMELEEGKKAVVPGCERLSGKVCELGRRMVSRLQGRYGPLPGIANRCRFRLRAAPAVAATARLLRRVRHPAGRRRGGRLGCFR